MTGLGLDWPVFSPDYPNNKIKKLFWGVYSHFLKRILFIYRFSRFSFSILHTCLVQKIHMPSPKSAVTVCPIETQSNPVQPSLSQNSSLPSQNSNLNNSILPPDWKRPGQTGPSPDWVQSGLETGPRAKWNMPRTTYTYVHRASSHTHMIVVSNSAEVRTKQKVFCVAISSCVCRSSFFSHLAE